ncbi:hypothetical protein TNCV_3147411 [Trichonephila clavipes]|nr:hypothetical protein TNCV_3147411 [Trichonephila clavipes]
MNGLRASTDLAPISPYAWEEFSSTWARTSGVATIVSMMQAPSFMDPQTFPDGVCDTGAGDPDGKSVRQKIRGEKGFLNRLMVEMVFLICLWFV